MVVRYEGNGTTIQEALAKAHGQIPPRQGRDFATSKVVDWGMQTGGFIATTLFYVVVEEDEHAPFRS